LTVLVALAQFDLVRINTKSKLPLDTLQQFTFKCSTSSACPTATGIQIPSVSCTLDPTARTNLNLSAASMQVRPIVRFRILQIQIKNGSGSFADSGARYC
jgi:hypothetical protein